MRWSWECEAEIPFNTVGRRTIISSPPRFIYLDNKFFRRLFRILLFSFILSRISELGWHKRFEKRKHTSNSSKNLQNTPKYPSLSTQRSSFICASIREKRKKKKQKNSWLSRRRVPFENMYKESRNPTRPTLIPSPQTRENERTRRVIARVAPRR